MTSERRLSRPVAAAARLLAADEHEAERLCRRARVLVRLGGELAHSPDAHSTLLLAVNEILRFCPNIAVEVPARHGALLDTCDALAADIHGPGARVERASSATVDRFSAILSIGLELRPGWVTVSSGGWVARVARGSRLPAECPARRRPRMRSARSPLPVLARVVSS